ncbi:RHS repeat-associated core domain-containing protein [uncultured Bacteroides sp.]|uniref:RHS repeat-associated core domain-containing protein n=1 Tax=uncultured Bacteroides sp. TaxID=162156 RepID=UPI002599DB9C|nr:RHS repeat-associated core domain-containing protein [uncultured Bacteroides sp.]
MFSRTVLLTNTDATTLARHAYSYQYDGRNSCIEKKLPGCETVRLIYDRADRLVLEQNGTQRAGNRWTVHKYDAIGRLLYSFEHTDATDIATLRNRLSGICATESDSGNDPLGIGYTNTTVGWGSDVRLLEVNYYDDYSFLDKLTSAERNALTYAARSGYDTCHTYADGLPTGNRHYLPDGTGRYVATALYYDNKGRTVQQTRTNLKGGYDRDSYANSFTGQVTKHFYTHTGSASDTGSLTCEYFYMYDSNDRLVAVDCALNGGTRSALYRLSYDSYGRMQQKTFGNGLYTGTYDYNLRGWLTGISGNKFSQALHYTDGPGTPCYNGNISSMTWQAGGETTTRGYKFTYDGLNRMLDAIYGEGTNIGSNANRFTEKVTGYDKNGNILALQRYGQTGASSYGLIDNLTFTLDGNQLNRVDDAVTSSAYNNGFEFKDAVKLANEYAYDANGNLTKDLNKNISNIQYNSLNLPSKVTFTDGSTIEYTYAADGTKLKVVHKIGSTTTTTDYCGNVIYENGVQKLLLTEAGYLTLADSKYHYYLQDHQGNNRVVIDQNGTVEEVNHYYPFGGVFANSTSVQPYKYNGKELDTKKGLNWYDYGARHYDAAVGRFHTKDRFAEKYYPMSPYQYAANCPMKNIDVNGDSIIIAPNPNGLIDEIKLWFGFDTKYQSQVKADLKQLKDADSMVKDMIEGLEISANTIVITDIADERQAKGQNGNRTYETSNGTNSSSQEITVEYSPYNTLTNNQNERPPIVGLVHELGHAAEISRGNTLPVNRGELKNGSIMERSKLMYNETYPIIMENRIRKVFNLNMRNPKGYLYGK